MDPQVIVAFIYTIGLMIFGLVSLVTGLHFSRRQRNNMESIAQSFREISISLKALADKQL